MENLKNIISKIDVPLFIIYGMDLSFWAELFVCVLIISPFYFLVRIVKKKYFSN